VGVFLKLHKISQSLDYWQIIMGVVIGFTLQATVTAYQSGEADIPLVNDTYVNNTVQDVENTINSSVENVTQSAGFGTGPGIREIAVNGSKYVGEEVTVTGMKSPTYVDALYKEGGELVYFECDQYDIAYRDRKTYTITGTLRSRQSISGETEHYVDCTEPPKTP